MISARAFKKIDAEDLRYFTGILGENYLLSDSGSIEKYGEDETEDLSFPPDLVLRPADPQQISAILSYCSKNNIPVTPRGAGSGLAGGSLPVHGGISLCTSRLNRILHIDEKNLQLTTEPGVITEVLQNAAAEKGLFYPPDPSSRGMCFIGGNVSNNSGGPKAVKYGVVKDYVLNLEVVLPTGEIIWTGADVLKNATGYNLTQLMVGSEGTLAVITKIVLRLIPMPRFNLVMLVPFRKMEEAGAAVSAIFRAGITPSCLEFMERTALDWVIPYLGDVAVSVEADVEAHLLVEVDGNQQEILYQDCEKLYEVLNAFDTGEILFADSDAQKADLWRLRRNVAHAVKSKSIYKEEDTVVPRAHLPELLAHIKAVGKEYGFTSVCYGHAGDGNVHVNIIKGELSDHDWQFRVPEGIRKIFAKVVELRGTISGEHGIGVVQKPYMNIRFSETEFRLMKGIKAVFDPAGILNPGKIF
jgi:glycolate oxidase